MEFLQEFPFAVTLPPLRPGEDEDAYWDRVDYFDTMAGTPPPAFLEKHGFPISVDNLIGIVPCSETVRKFGSRLTSRSHYEALQDTCDAFNTVLDVPFFYETMYTDDIYYYLESASDRVGLDLYDYPKKWAIPGDDGGLKMFSLEIDAAVLRRRLEEAPYPFLFIVPDDEDEASDSDLPPPNEAFMSMLEDKLRRAVTDDEDDEDDSQATITGEYDDDYDGDDDDDDGSDGEGDRGGKNDAGQGNVGNQKRKRDQDHAHPANKRLREDSESSTTLAESSATVQDEPDANASLVAAKKANAAAKKATRAIVATRPAKEAMKTAKASTPNGMSATNIDGAAATATNGASSSAS